MKRRDFLALLASAPIAAQPRQFQQLSREAEQNFDVFAVEGSHAGEVVPWRSDTDRAVPLRKVPTGYANAVNGRSYLGTLRCKGTPRFWHL